MTVFLLNLNSGFSLRKREAFRSIAASGKSDDESAYRKTPPSHILTAEFWFKLNERFLLDTVS